MKFVEVINEAHSEIVMLNIAVIKHFQRDDEDHDLIYITTLDGQEYQYRGSMNNFLVQAGIEINVKYDD